MESPTSPPALDNLDVKSLAKATRKSFERLEPWCHLQTTSDYPEAGPLVAKIVKRVNAYIHAIDSTMLAAQIGYRLASEAMTLCDLMGEDDFIDEGRDNLDTMKALADEGYENAEKTNVAFREIRQELYKTAAETKGKTYIVEVPLDPAQDTMLLKPLKEVGSDLVENAGLLVQFSNHASEFSAWWGFIKSEVAAGKTSSLFISPNGTDPALNTAPKAQWQKLQREYLGFYHTVSDLQDLYPDLLSGSTGAWRDTLSPSAMGSHASYPSESFVQPSGRFRVLAALTGRMSLLRRGKGRAQKENATPDPALLHRQADGGQETQQITTLMQRLMRGRSQKATGKEREQDGAPVPAPRPEGGEEEGGTGATGRQVTGTEIVPAAPSVVSWVTQPNDAGSGRDARRVSRLEGDARGDNNPPRQERSALDRVTSVLREGAKYIVCGRCIIIYI